MNCPICNKVLLRAGDDVFCQTRVQFEQTNIAHYECRDKENPIWYVPPYKIVYGDGKSAIYVIDGKDIGGKYHKPGFEFLMEINEEIHPDDPVKVAKRIKNLIIFS